MYSDKKTWKKYIQKYQLKSINLFAENSWTSKIEKDFGIRGIPHSVLVDENGKVFQNKCARPSEDISKEIDKLLIKDY
jgi:thioredoxin-like negative regulator of GroEL